MHVAATSCSVVRVAMALTPEQKRKRRRLDREAAAAGDADAQKRRAAERERIDKKFLQRTAAEQRERMKERRRRIRSAAEKGDVKANELLNHEADRSVSRRNTERALQAGAAVDTDGTVEFIKVFAALVDASQIRKYIAEHPDSTPGTGWHLAPRYLGSRALKASRGSRAVRRRKPLALQWLYAIAFCRAAVTAIFESCLNVGRHFGPGAARVALAQRFLAWEEPDPHAPDEVKMATNHHTGVVEIPPKHLLWQGCTTVEMRRGLWAEAWEVHKGAFAADLLCLGQQPAVCHAAAVTEIQRRVEELTTRRDQSLGPPPAGGFSTGRWWELRYDGCQLSGSTNFRVSDRGLPQVSVDAAVSSCLDMLYAKAPYGHMRIWVVHETVICSSHALLGVGKCIPPAPASLGLTPWSVTAAEPPVAPANACRAATIEYDQTPSTIRSSNGCSSNAKERACRIFVQNLSWGTGDAELTAYLDTAIPGSVISASVMRHADGRSRGIAKVVVQAPIDAETVIEELNGKELDGRALSIAHDRF